MQETIPKITLPCGFVFAANHSGTITPAQVERIKLNKLDVTNYHLGWKGMFLLGYSLAYYVTAFTHLFEDRWHGRGNIVFPVLIGMSLIIFLIVLTKELTEIWEGIKCKLWAFQDIRSRAIKTAEGSLAISLRNTPVIQIGGRVLQLLPYPPNFSISPLEANLEIVPGKKYRVHYLEKSGLALSAEEIGLEETESIETYQLAFAGKYPFSELAKNRLGIFTGSQKIWLMSGITGSLLAMLLILIMAILMAPVLSVAVGYAIPNTLSYLIYWFFLQVFPLGVVVFFIAAVGKKPLLVVADILINQDQNSLWSPY